MKPFRFRLQRLLRLMQGQKQQLVVALARAQTQADDARRAHIAAQTLAFSVADAYLRLREKPATASDWETARDALNAARGRVDQHAVTVRKADALVEEARERLVDHSRQVEVYERLRLRRLREHEIDSRRTDQKGLDAVAIDQHAQTQRDRERVS